MITIIHGIARYASGMGVFHEWHPLVITTLMSLSSGGGSGVTYLRKFVADSIADWNKSSEEEKSMHEQKSDGGALLETDYLGSLLAKSRRTPETFKVEDAHYHLIAQIGAGGETTGNEMVAAVRFLCKYPKVMEKLRREVEDVKLRSKDARISGKEAHECAYLQVRPSSVDTLNYCVSGPINHGNLFPLYHGLRRTLPFHNCDSDLALLAGIHKRNPEAVSSSRHQHNSHSTERRAHFGWPHISRRCTLH